MGLFRWLASKFSKPKRRGAIEVNGDRVLALEKQIYPRSVQARYDAAQTTSDNARHWVEADYLSAETANDPATRRELRSRSRYECLEANSLAHGIVNTMTSSVIGVGPRLKVTIPDNPEAARTIERAFMAWAREIRLAYKLRTAKTAKTVDGEAFIQQINNSQLRSPVQLDLALVEADMIATPDQNLPPNAVDGIEFDSQGNPTVYHRLRTHPGGTASPFNTFDMSFDRIPAEEVIHLFKADRPGQKRGVPEVTTALPLFAMLRRYGLAVLSAAEAVANVSAVLYTDSAAVEADTIDPLDAIDFERNMMMSLPSHWKMAQIKAEQPTTTFGDFRSNIVSEIGRCLDMPLIIADLNAKGANFSSSKLDVLNFNRSVNVERQVDWDAALDRIFFWWFDEASMIAGVVPEGIGANAVEVTWMWQSNEAIDEAKTAQSTMTNLASGVTNYPLEYAKLGMDWEDQQAAAAASLGVSVEEYRELLRQSVFDAQAASEPTEQQPSDEEAAA